MCRNAVVSISFSYWDVPFDGGGVIVRNVLVGVCDQCEVVVSIPVHSVQAARCFPTETAETRLSLQDSVRLTCLSMQVFNIEKCTSFAPQAEALASVL